MIPGELFIKDGEIELNAGRKTATLTVANTGALELQGGITVGAEALSIAGTGVSNSGVLRNVSRTMLQQMPQVQ